MREKSKEKKMMEITGLTYCLCVILVAMIFTGICSPGTLTNDR